MKESKWAQVGNEPEELIDNIEKLAAENDALKMRAKELDDARMAIAEHRDALKAENDALREACRVAIKMLDGECQHGYTTRGCGCDACYDQINNAI